MSITHSGSSTKQNNEKNKGTLTFDKLAEQSCIEGGAGGGGGGGGGGGRRGGGGGGSAAGVDTGMSNAFVNSAVIDSLFDGI